ncbi:MAG: GTPase HflX [Clostridiaceae bacterium]|nr:GTPase HflX [Eubacteriales bacterium]
MAQKVNGNTEGVKASLLEQIALLYDMRMNPDEFASFELLERMAEFTARLGREVSVYLGRDGRVQDVSLGDTGKVSMPTLRLVRNEDRLSGVRCIHTHPNGDARPSGVDLGTLRSARLDSMASMGVSADGKPLSLYAAYLGDMEENERAVALYGPLRPYKLPNKLLMQEIYAADARLKSSTKEVLSAKPQRAILAGLESNNGFDSMAELEELALSAGAQVVGRFTQRRREIDNATYIGSGKADELSLAASELEADLIIFDDELSAIQVRNLENATSTAVIDRTTLILDIFAARAQSREGKLQVELAQLKYSLPHLLGQGRTLSQQGAGIGTRGPGERKLEIDRRRIKRRIYELQTELEEIEKQRGLRRERREKNKVPLVALVGYTNTGKSTLLNAISGAGVLAEDKLFATLDPVVRQAELEGGTAVLFSDTVGFISKLPHDLVEAFRSTLEEVKEADLVLHVIDASSPELKAQKAVVEEVLASLGALDTPRIEVYNKTDKLPEKPVPHEGAAYISALNGMGVPELLNMVGRALGASHQRVELLIPYGKYEAMSLIRAEGKLLSEEHAEDGTKVTALLDEQTLWKLKKLLGG